MSWEVTGELFVNACSWYGLGTGRFQADVAFVRVTDVCPPVVARTGQLGGGATRLLRGELQPTIPF